MQEARSQDHLVKILLLGDTTVGKSCLVRRFVDDKFDSNTTTTIGVDFKERAVAWDDCKLRLQVWDTAGQERFRCITPSYYRVAQAVLIVFDITRRSTFDQVGTWIQQLESHTPGISWTLLGNKADLASSREVAHEEAEALACRFGMPYRETSAKTGECVEEVFVGLAETVVKQREAVATTCEAKDTKRVSLVAPPPRRGACVCGP
jgi:small GTP-binding protein